MKLKIVQPTWENFTGEFGGIEFVDGVSVDDVSKVQATRVANQILIETLEGDNPSSSQVALNERSMSMDSNAGGEAQSVVTSQFVKKQWTQGELEALAEAKGIAAVREISDPLSLKSNSVVKLIALILSAQKPAAPVDAQTLYGSDVQPALFEVNGETVQLGTIVAAAHVRSGKTVEEWNALPVEERERLIQAEVTYVTGAAK